MKKLIILVALMLSITEINAQNSPVFFKDSISKSNVIGLNFSYENTLYMGVSYDRILSLKGQKISIGVDVGSPIVLLTKRNKRISINASTYLLKSNFNIRTQFFVSSNFYEDALSKGQFMDFGIGLFPGYYRSKYFIASEISYRNNIFTTFNFKDISPIQGDLILTNTTGSFRLGLNGGGFVKKRLELKFSLYYNMPRDLKNYPPFTQNIGFNLGANYWF